MSKSMVFRVFDVHFGEILKKMFTELCKQNVTLNWRRGAQSENIVTLQSCKVFFEYYVRESFGETSNYETIVLVDL